jgi:hypothetical protein
MAGKSTLNRLELSRGATCYHKIGHDPAAIENLFVTFCLEAHKAALAGNPACRHAVQSCRKHDPLHAGPPNSKR